MFKNSKILSLCTQTCYLNKCLYYLILGTLTLIFCKANICWFCKKNFYYAISVMATQKLSDCVRFVLHSQMNDDTTFYKIFLQNKLSFSFHLKDLVLLTKLKTK